MKNAEKRLAEAIERGISHARRDFGRNREQFESSLSYYLCHTALFREDAERFAVTDEAEKARTQLNFDRTEVVAYVQEYYRLIQTITPPSA